MCDDSTAALPTHWIVIKEQALGVNIRGCALEVLSAVSCLFLDLSNKF